MTISYAKQQVNQKEKLTSPKGLKLPYNLKQDSILKEFSPCPEVLDSYSIINKDYLKSR